MSITSGTSTSINCSDSLLCINEAQIKTEPTDDYEETNLILIKQELEGDDENEANDNEYYGYIDAASLEEIDGNLIAVSENHSEGDGEFNLQNVNTKNYVMICEEDADNSGLLHLRLVNKPLVNEVEKSIENTSKIKLTTKPRLKTNGVFHDCKPEIHRPFKCSECNERFEVKSHLVMHEIGHERYKKYKPINFGKINSESGVSEEPILSICVKSKIKSPFKCSICSAKFELKSQVIRHELQHKKLDIYKRMKMKINSTVQTVTRRPDTQIYNRVSAGPKSHPTRKAYCENQNLECKCRKGLYITRTSDLCMCFVRVCQFCHTEFYAAIKLGNWTTCMKCFFPNDKGLKGMHEIQILNEHNTYMNKYIQTVDMKKKSVSNMDITSGRKLCFSCGKMCSDVISYRCSWMCYDCWNAKLEKKGIKRISKEEYTTIKTGKKNRKVGCMYCLEVFPHKSLQRDHKCPNKPAYIDSKFLDIHMESTDSREVKFPVDEIGHHFLSAPMDYSCNSPIFPENVTKNLKMPSRQISGHVLSYKQFQLEESQNYGWNTYSDDDDDPPVYNEEDTLNQDVLDTKEEEDDSRRTKILCDKTGQIIDLSSETISLQQTENMSVQQ